MRTLCFLVAGCFSISGLFFGAVAAFSDHETVPLAASLALGFGSAIVAGLFIACGILAEMNDRGRA